jgi:Phosphoribosyl transferase domain
VTVKVAILDLDGTLLQKHTTVAQPGAVAMIRSLREAGLRVAVASNSQGFTQVSQRLTEAGVPHDWVIDRTMAGKAKGSGAWVDRVCDHFGTSPRELVWLGDSDLDMRSAVQRRVVYFHARWGDEPHKYGIRVDQPEHFAFIVLECFAKSHPWWWLLNTQDNHGRPVSVWALVDGNGAGSNALKQLLLATFKDDVGPQLGPFAFRELATWHLLGSLYDAGVPDRVDVWTGYPGHRGSLNESLVPFGRLAALEFRDSYLRDIFVRHHPAEHSRHARTSRQDRGLENQLETIHLNPSHRERIVGKRVIVVDDFITAGNSMECARNLLLAGGAAEVTIVGIGKYGTRYMVATPESRDAFDAYQPLSVGELPRFSRRDHAGSEERTALSIFKNSCDRAEQLVAQ